MATVPIIGASRGISFETAPIFYFPLSCNRARLLAGKRINFFGRVAASSLFFLPGYLATRPIKRAWAGLLTATLLIYFSAMSPNARYWTLHWLRVLLWPLPVLSLFRTGRRTVGKLRRQ